MLRDGRAAAGNNAADWIRAIAENEDRAAFASLFEFYAPRIKAMLTRLGAAADAAEDLAQETLLTVWRKAAYFDPARASASAWIFTIARNLRIDRLRGDNRAKLYAPYEMVEPEGPENPDSALNAAERDATRARSAQGAVAGTSSRRAAFVLRRPRPWRYRRAAQSAAGHGQVARPACHGALAQSVR